MEAVKTDCFYLFDGRPVTIEKILPFDGRRRVEIKHVQRTLKGKHEEVDFDCLEELTDKLANETIAKYNRTIRECNVRIHAFNECLRYM